MPWRGQPSIHGVLTTQSRLITAGVPSLIEQPVETKVCLNRFTRLIDLSIYGHSSLPIVVAVSHPTPRPAQPGNDGLQGPCMSWRQQDKRTHAHTPTHTRTRRLLFFFFKSLFVTDCEKRECPWRLHGRTINK